ncbi:hypothetical protein BH11PSE10_BH11PSE10_20100 [soil metagenome]
MIQPWALLPLALLFSACGGGGGDSSGATTSTSSPAAASTPVPLPMPSPVPAGGLSPAPTPAPTPDPAPAPIPSPAPSPGPSPTPGPSPSPSPTPAPAPTPAPSPTPAPAPVYAAVSGNLAAGAALGSAKLRIIDATSKAIVTDLVVPASGAFGPITLSGTGPFRIEACGTLGEKYRCLYSATALGGPTNITPLTSAIVLLASGQAPEALMAASSATVGLDAASFAAAQTQLRNALSAAIADAGLSSAVDFFADLVTAGSRIGQDRLLDDLGLSWGVDGSKPFVLVSPRLGSGSLYLEPGTTQGSIAINTAAAGLNLTGIEALFGSMSAAIASSTACNSTTTGLATLIASNARSTLDGAPALNGPTDVALGMCSTLSGLLGDGSISFGGVLQSAELGRCDFSGSAPVCRVGMAVKSAKGQLLPWGVNQAVTLEAGAWKFLGNMQALPISAQATAQRLRRVDGTALVDSYARLISVSIGNASGLGCARVTQKNLSGVDSTLAYYKPHSSGAALLSLWNVDAAGNVASLNPAAGATRGVADRAFPLAPGADGDAIVRNFYRSGREISVALFSDSTCTSAFTPSGAGSSSFTIELPGVPPLSAALAGLPWPTMTAASNTALASLKGGAKAKISYTANWTFAREVLGVEAAQLCSDAACAVGAGRIGELALIANPRTATLAPTLGATALAANGFKQLRLVGRSAEGLLLHADNQSCSAVTAGQTCN